LNYFGVEPVKKGVLRLAKRNKIGGLTGRHNTKERGVQREPPLAE